MLCPISSCGATPPVIFDISCPKPSVLEKHPFVLLSLGSDSDRQPGPLAGPNGFVPVVQFLIPQ